MSDAIDRQAAIEAIADTLKYEDYGFLSDELESVINNVPAADVVEVVRCKDCAYYDKDYSDELSDWCHVWSETTRYDGYCHEAEPYKGD